MDGTAWESHGGSQRVQRGGSYRTSPDPLSSAYRNYSGPDGSGDLVGFRVARTVAP